MGLQNGHECWGDNISDEILRYEQVEENECDKPCEYGAYNSTCGGFLRNSVYNISMQFEVQIDYSAIESNEFELNAKF